MIRLKESKIFWPLILFPFASDNSHTRSYTGRCWAKNIKASFSFARIELTDTKLTCWYRLFNLLILDLSLRHIEEIENIEDKPGLIQVKFQSALFGNLTKFALSGQPSGSKNRVILNVMDERAWLTNLGMQLT